MSREEERVVFVGRKPPMAYVQAMMNSFGRGSNTVVLKARGRSISTAVDAAEIIRRMMDLEVKDIRIDTVVLGDDKRNVSTIDITVTKRG
jgi:DNA-binding protein